MIYHLLQDGWTPLHYAAHNDFVDVLQTLLLAEQCDVMICNHVSINMHYYTSYFVSYANFLLGHKYTCNLWSKLHGEGPLLFL